MVRFYFSLQLKNKQDKEYVSFRRECLSKYIFNNISYIIKFIYRNKVYPRLLLNTKRSVLSIYRKQWDMLTALRRQHCARLEGCGPCRWRACALSTLLAHCQSEPHTAYHKPIPPSVKRTLSVPFNYTDRERN